MNDSRTSVEPNSDLNPETSKRRTEANRKNALKSTGPKRADGKARSSRNSLKHGILSTLPVIPGIESTESWEQHRSGIFESLNPVGYLEEMLAMQIATDSWRRARAIRYETQLIEASFETVEFDVLESMKNEIGIPLDPVEAGEIAEIVPLAMETLKGLPHMSADQKLEKDAALQILHAIVEVFPDTAANVIIPGIPCGDSTFDGCTAGSLRKWIELYAKAERISTEACRSKCLYYLYKKHHDAASELRRWNLALEYERRNRILLPSDKLNIVMRYESAFERSMLKSLHELERRQAARVRGFVPPPTAVDVDVTIEPADLDDPTFAEEVSVQPSPHADVSSTNHDTETNSDAVATGKMIAEPHQESDQSDCETNPNTVGPAKDPTGPMDRQELPNEPKPIVGDADHNVDSAMQEGETKIEN